MSAANAPVFSLTDRYLNHGEVGGDISSGIEQGKLAGKMATRFLNGEKQLVPAMQLGALDLSTDHRELVAQDQYLGFGVRGDSAQPENASEERVDERVEHGRAWYENAGQAANRVSVPHR